MKEFEDRLQREKEEIKKKGRRRKAKNRLRKKLKIGRKAKAS